MIRTVSAAIVALSLALPARGAEKTVVSLRDYCSSELKYAGMELSGPATIHIRALGGGGSQGWTYKSDRMFAYGWILNAATREPVWTMTVANTNRSGDDRTFDGKIRLERGRYEVYFVVYGFAYHTSFKHIVLNIDHRRDPLFGFEREEKKGLFSWFSDWFSDDLVEEWKGRCSHWGIDLLVDEASSGAVRSLAVEPELPHSVIRAVGLGEDEVVREAFSVARPVRLRVYAIGEGLRDDELADFGWIVNRTTRERVWQMTPRSVRPAGGAEKCIMADDQLSLEPGDYVLYYITDDSHSAVDWNDAPPADPLNYGVTIAAQRDADRGLVRIVPYKEITNVIVSIVRVGDSEYRSEGFTLKRETPVRIYAFGERSSTRVVMVDEGMILDARTRKRVWEMNASRTFPAGGAAKNRLVDEVTRLPAGSYIVVYSTDDSHAYGDWNASPPFDQEHYGITVMGADRSFDPSVVAPFVEERDKGVIAQLTRVRNDANLREPFTLDRTTRLRIYALGEGVGRQMYDYGWIENASTGTVVWEMTYSMTFHAGGGRKNRSVNTTLVLEKGDYILRYRSDDSHSYNDWNDDPPNDPEYWGITLYRDESLEPAPAPRVRSSGPVQPAPPAMPREASPSTGVPPRDPKPPQREATPQPEKGR
jgi:hypothetical protein